MDQIMKNIRKSEEGGKVTTGVVDPDLYSLIPYQEYLENIKYNYASRTNIDSGLKFKYHTRIMAFRKKLGSVQIWNRAFIMRI